MFSGNLVVPGIGSPTLEVTKTVPSCFTAAEIFAALILNSGGSASVEVGVSVKETCLPSINIVFTVLFKMLYFS